jgi:2-(1,2-epoxy-1,2-dihydrophenyl)acetyl-CoA isomerase
MSQDCIRFELADRVARITLNRPEVLNSFDRAMSARLQEVIHAVSLDEAVRAVYLTGAGRAFCAGQDLAEAAPKDAEPIADFAEHVRRMYNPVVLALRGLDKPVVCGVNGVAAGAGANLALACDLVIAAQDASFIQAFVKIGLVPDTGGTWFLPRLVGTAQATALAMLGEKISAERAAEIGLIYKVCPAAALEETAFGLARQLATQPTKALALIKRMLNASAGATLPAQLELEAESQGEAGRTADYAEGVRAFHDKRPPAFTGK